MVVYKKLTPSSIFSDIVLDILTPNKLGQKYSPLRELKIKFTVLYFSEQINIAQIRHSYHRIKSFKFSQNLNLAPDQVHILQVLQQIIIE